MDKIIFLSDMHITVCICLERFLHGIYISIYHIVRTALSKKQGNKMETQETVKERKRIYAWVRICLLTR